MLTRYWYLGLGIEARVKLGFQWIAQGRIHQGAVLRVEWYKSGWIGAGAEVVMGWCREAMNSVVESAVGSGRRTKLMCENVGSC